MRASPVFRRRRRCRCWRWSAKWRRLGGAGNVARNIASLGGRATLIGGKGRDLAGDRIGALLAHEPAITDALLASEGGRTTEKIRYIADQQQVMRADYEAPWPDGEKARRWPPPHRDRAS